MVLQCIYFLVNLPFFWYPNAPRSLRHVTHLQILLRTAELTLITQRPIFRRLFNVILLPLCATFSWHHVTNASVIKFAFGKITGCTSLMSSIDLFNLPPTVKTLSVSSKGSNLKRQLDLYIIVLDFNQEVSWLNECCCGILNIISWVFSNSSIFIGVATSGLGFVILFIYIYAANSSTTIIFLILIQLEDIISSFDVTLISAFTMFSWSLFFNSGSPSFTDLIECLSRNHVFFSEDQRKACPSNYLCILLKFLESSPRDASSAGLSHVDTYYNCWASVWSWINSTRLATKTLNLQDSLLI